MPVIETLKLDLNMESNFKILLLHCSFLKLQELDELARNFPSIIKFDVSLDGTSLKYLWTTWPGLQELRLHFSQTSDVKAPSIDGFLTAKVFLHRWVDFLQIVV